MDRGSVSQAFTQNEKKLALKGCSHKRAVILLLVAPPGVPHWLWDSLALCPAYMRANKGFSGIQPAGFPRSSAPQFHKLEGQWGTGPPSPISIHHWERALATRPLGSLSSPNHSLHGTLPESACICRRHTSLSKLERALKG